MLSPEQLKREFQESLQSIRARHRKGEGGVRIALALTEAIDTILQNVFRLTGGSEKSPLCLIALGGYGRKELSFGSDTDVMFLIPKDDQGTVAALAVQKILHAMLDLGLDIGHSVRTTDDCLALYDSDQESWVSLLESRHLCGNRSLGEQFLDAVKEQLRTLSKERFAQELMARLEIRHQKYAASSKLLEPNIKNSAGGLRDLHTVLWLLAGTGTIAIPYKLSKTDTAVTFMLRSRPLMRLIEARQIRATRDAFDVLLRTRNEMHLLSKGLHDTLEFTLQKQVAEALGYTSTPTRSSVEKFMQEYHIAARQVVQVSRRVLRAVQASLAAESAPSRPLDDSFVLRGTTLAPKKKKLAITNALLLRAAVHAIQNGVTFAPELEDLIAKQVHRCKPLRSSKDTKAFREFLNQPSGVGQALLWFSEAGVLERWIPEWKDLVAFFQHNQYHYFTADEHTLRVVANAESLVSSSANFGEVFRSLPRRDTLTLTCLLHDIAKPKRVGDHEVIGAEMAQTILKRLRYEDIAEDVEFLVRNHLLMEQVAFRRNLSDPQTIIDFASRIPRPYLLDFLYVLTYADLSAVNKNVWTDWKGMLLFELYKKSKEILDGKMTGEEVHIAARSKHTTAVNELVESLSEAIPQDSSRTHLEAVDSPAYLATFDAAEIADHIRHIERNEPVVTLFKHHPTFTEVTIIARDAPFALSRFCGVLSANDSNIFDAHIFTRSDGMIIDKFRVTDFVSRSVLQERQCQKITQELDDVMSGKTDIAHLLERHRMKWRRLSRNQQSSARSDVSFEEHPRFTIIDVYAPDRMGFLYKITEAMSMLNLTISFAKIATRADGIVDSFYVLDASGERIVDAERKEHVRTVLLQIINDLAESELVQA